MGLMHCWGMHRALPHTQGVQQDTRAAWLSWQEGEAQGLPRLRSSHSGEVGAAPSA